MAATEPVAEALSLYLPDEAATVRLARRLAALARPGDVIALTGELGSGKTALARAFINALEHPGDGAAEEEVPSPTFTLVQIYDRRPAPVWHVDLYRVERPEETDELGLDEALGEDIVLIEWPDRMGGRLPAGRLDVTLTFAETEGARHAVLQGGDAWAGRLDALAEGGDG